MCTTTSSIELNTFQIDDKDLPVATNNICEKNVQIIKIDDTSASHQPTYVSFLDDPPACHLPDINLTKLENKRNTLWHYHLDLLLVQGQLEIRLTDLSRRKG